jgi:hypothetical protein
MFSTKEVIDSYYEKHYSVNGKRNSYRIDNISLHQTPKAARLLVSGELFVM